MKWQSKEDNAKRGIFRRSVRFIRWRSPIRTEHQELFSAARAAFTIDRPVCPDCVVEGRGGRLRPVPERADMRRCDTCDFTVTLHDLAQRHAPEYTPSRRRDFFLRRAAGYFITACILLSAAVLYSAWRGSWFMFIFALIFSMPLFMSVFAMRYRAWQVEKSRMFEVQAPLRDYMRDELAALVRWS